MKVRILSGNQVGHIVEMSQLEAESAIAFGYAAAVETKAHVVKAEVVKVVPAEVEEKPKSSGKKR